MHVLDRHASEVAQPPADVSACGFAPPRLGLWDTVGIIVGIVVGTAIFTTPPLVFQNVSGPWQALGVWLLGGLLSFLGALCYAELATTYPRSGGDYEYLTRAYGRAVGFVFGWAQLAIVLTGSIAAMAYAFADYGVRLWGLDQEATVSLAIASVVGLSAINLLGVVAGKTTQNVLTGAKVLGLVIVVVAGIVAGSSGSTTLAAPSSTGAGGLGLAMVFVLYAYGGWNDAAFVSADVRDARRNIPRSLLYSIGIITAVYLVINATFLWVLGFDAARQSWTPAADVLQQVAGPWAAKAISLLVMISALSAINGLILTGSRIFQSLGDDHRLFSLLAVGNQRLGVPLGAIVAQAIVSLVLIVTVGTAIGQRSVDHGLQLLGMQALPWAQYHGGFETLVAAAAPVFWIFFLLTGIAQFILRARDWGRSRPFSTPWFPLPTIVFCLTCLFMLHASLDYAKGLCLIALAPVALGLPLYWLSQSRQNWLPSWARDSRGTHALQRASVVEIK